MTPKEKARELVDKYHKIHTINNYEVKQCALIAIDEIIEVLSKDINSIVNYWFEVKQEINKL